MLVYWFYAFIYLYFDLIVGCDGNDRKIMNVWSKFKYFYSRYFNTIINIFFIMCIISIILKFGFFDVALADEVVKTTTEKNISKPCDVYPYRGYIIPPYDEYIYGALRLNVPVFGELYMTRFKKAYEFMQHYFPQLFARKEYIDPTTTPMIYFMSYHGNSPFFIPELFLCILILILLFLNLYLKKYNFSYDIVNVNIYLSLLGILFTIVLLYYQITSDYYLYMLDYSFVTCSLIVKVKIFILILVFFVLALSLDYFKLEKFQVFEYPIIVLLSVLGMFILISANDLMVIYLAIELQSFCFYILSALKKYSNLSIEAALKYFIQGSYSSALLLFGISLIYGHFGTVNFIIINNLIFTTDLYSSFDHLFIFGLLFLTLGILFKLGVVPFHFWLPDVYEGSPTIVTALFSIVTKFSFLVLFIKIYFFVFFKLASIFNLVFLFVGLISIIFGSIMSLYQVKIKRLLAYSAITNMGYILISISLFSTVGLEAFLMYFIIYVMLSINIFSILLVFRSNPDFFKVRNLVEFASLLRSNFLLAVIFAFNLLSFAGVPPLAGFFGKFMVYQALMSSNNFFLALCLVLLSVLSSVYYISWYVLCFLMIS